MKKSADSVLIHVRPMYGIDATKAPLKPAHNSDPTSSTSLLSKLQSTYQMTPFLSTQPTAQMAGSPPTQTPSSSTQKRPSHSTSTSATTPLLFQTMTPCSFNAWNSSPRLPNNSTKHAFKPTPSSLSAMAAQMMASDQPLNHRQLSWQSIRHRYELSPHPLQHCVTQIIAFRIVIVPRFLVVLGALYYICSEVIPNNKIADYRYRHMIQRNREPDTYHQPRNNRETCLKRPMNHCTWNTSLPLTQGRNSPGTRCNYCSTSHDCCTAHQIQ
jgi:hypothetical protein